MNRFNKILFLRVMKSIIMKNKNQKVRRNKKNSNKNKPKNNQHSKQYIFQQLIKIVHKM